MKLEKSCLRDIRNSTYFLHSPWQVPAIIQFIVRSQDLDMERQTWYSLQDLSVMSCAVEEQVTERWITVIFWFYSLLKGEQHFAKLLVKLSFEYIGLTNTEIRFPEGNRKMKSELKVLVALLSPTLCNPMDCSPPGSSVHGVLQARVVQWVAIPFSRRSSWPRD